MCGQSTPETTTFSRALHHSPIRSLIFFPLVQSFFILSSRKPAENLRHRERTTRSKFSATCFWFALPQRCERAAGCERAAVGKRCHDVLRGRHPLTLTALPMVITIVCSKPIFEGGTIRHSLVVVQTAGRVDPVTHHFPQIRSNFIGKCGMARAMCDPVSEASKFIDHRNRFRRSWRITIWSR